VTGLEVELRATTNHNQDGSGTVGPDHRRAHFFGSVYAAGVILTTAPPRGRSGGQQVAERGRAGSRPRRPHERCGPTGSRTGRLKTATNYTVPPARVDRRSVALDQLEEQPSDAEGRYFSLTQWPG